MIQNQMSSDFIRKINIKIISLSLVGLVVMLLYYKDAIANGLFVSNAVQPSKYFIARENELKQLKDYLVKGEGVASVVGVAGIGKTQMVRKYVDMNKNKYKIIWLFNCRRNLVPQFQELAVQVNVFCTRNQKCRVYETPDLVVESVMNYLKKSNNWLIILDNYNHDLQSDIMHYFNDMHKKDGRHIIYAARNKMGLKNIVVLKPFQRLDSLKLIHAISGLQTEESESLAEMVKDYPLALSKVSFFLQKNKFVTYKELKLMLTKNREVVEKIYRDNRNEYFVEDYTISKLIQHCMQNLDSTSIDLLIFIASLDNFNVSKNFLADIIIQKDYCKVNSKQDFLNGLLELTQNSLIEHKQGNNMESKNTEIFEMHDFVKDLIKENTQEGLFEKKLRELVQKVNALISVNINEMGLLGKKYPFLLTNLESLLENVQHYKADDVDLLRLRRGLLLIYGYNLDYHNIKQQISWFDRVKKELDLDDVQKRSLYAHFISYKGQYVDFIDEDSELALECFEEALSLLDPMEKNNYILVFDILTNKAQTLVDYGDLTGANIAIDQTENLLKQYTDISDIGFFYFVKGYIALAANDINNAQYYIDKLEQKEGHLPQDIFTAPNYILKAELLNKLGSHKEALDLMKATLSYLNQSFETEHELKARVLSELAVSELKIGDYKSAIQHTDKAINELLSHNASYVEQEKTKNYSDGLAMLYHTKADIEFAMGRFNEALRLYKQSIEIFHKRYRKIEVDRMSELYSSAAKAAFKVQDNFLFRFYLEKQEKYFGIDHHRTKALYEIML